jgi:hypothetical protein
MTPRVRWRGASRLVRAHCRANCMPTDERRNTGDMVSCQPAQALGAGCPAGASDACKCCINVEHLRERVLGRLEADAVRHGVPQLGRLALRLARRLGCAARRPAASDARRCLAAARPTVPISLTPRPYQHTHCEAGGSITPRQIRNTRPIALAKTPALAAHHVHRRVAGTRTDRDLLQARPRTQRRAGPLRDEVADAPRRRPRFQQARRAGRAGARLYGSAPALLGDCASRQLLHVTFAPRMLPEQRALLGSERGRSAGAGVAARRRRHRRARSAPPGGAPAGGAANARARARRPARGAGPGRRRWAPPRRTACSTPPARAAQQLS